MSDNSFYSAPAGWYPDPLGLPQLRWWDSTAWTHQVAEARQPMVMQETTFAWADDEPENDVLSRRERRERERKDPVDRPKPTAQMLLQLEPPQRHQVQTDVPGPIRDDEPVGRTDYADTAPPHDSYGEAPHQTSRSDAHYRSHSEPQQQAPHGEPQQAFGSERQERAPYGEPQPRTQPPTSYGEPQQQAPYSEPQRPTSYSEPQRESADSARRRADSYEPQFEPAPAQQHAQPASAFADPEPAQQPFTAVNRDWAPAWYGEAQPQQGAGWVPQAAEHQRRQYRITHTASVWIIALIPMVQLVLSLLLITAFGMGENVMMMAAIWLLPYPIVIALAFFDRRELIKDGHRHTAHWAWALLTAPVYLLVRAVASIRDSGNGFGPVLVWMALSLALIGSIVAVPGIAIATLPAVFASEAEASITTDATLIGTTMTVTCPDTPPVIIGQQFECIGVRSTGQGLRIAVSLERVNGWIKWRVLDWGIYATS